MTGIDINAGEIKTSNLRKAELFDEQQYYPQFLKGDAENLSLLKPASFDFIICSEVLEHLRHPEKTLSSLYCILKQNGLFIVTVPNGYGPYSLIFDQFRNKIVSKLFSRIEPSEHVQAFTFSAFTRLIEKAGFKILKVNHSDFISFMPLLVQFDRFCVWDCKLADKLPPQLASGWYLACQKKSDR
jgi:ubiquinone/menaquinone biosynthesis C-methylase UbiE